MSKLLWILALCLSSALAAPWSVSFGGCTFSGDTSGAPLERSGSCPTQSGWLYLNDKGITLVKNDSFAGMGACTSLQLGENLISGLPLGVFDGLTSLT